MPKVAETLENTGEIIVILKGAACQKEKPSKRRTRIRTTTKYRSEQRKSFQETGRTSLSFKSLLVYTLGLRMQYRGVYKEECSMKKVCASLFLIILLLAAIVPVSAAGTLR